MIKQTLNAIGVLIHEFKLRAIWPTYDTQLNSATFLFIDPNI